ncbi:hypothetical protein [Pseudonocardia humida]|uniref:Beta-lactamase family protein n=1 Tax=Pseudonocardia humida TaxID=2800819 RepID=A0ABT1A1Q8_9PSEU|nr:hypothetical protein [Pseudonocardia humida]MCO1656941.1 hypothetical protein [Pseudonocardia humida]
MGTRASAGTPSTTSPRPSGNANAVAALLLVLVTLAACVACTTASDVPPLPRPAPSPVAPAPTAPARPAVGPEGLSARIEAFLGASRWGRYDRVSAVVVRVDGRTVVDRRRPGPPEQRREVTGFTSAVLVALVGVLLDRGELGAEGLRGVRRPVAELLPPSVPAPLPEPLAAVAATPLHEVLVGTSGDDTAAIAALLTAATGRPVPDLARELLFDPLGVDPPWTGSGPAVTAQEMAAVAELWLDHGAVDGRQVVPARWMDAATRPYAETGRRTLPYAGYRQWLTRVDRHAAVVLTGEECQIVEVVPRLELVVVVGCDEDPTPDVAIPASSEAFLELVASTVVPALG